MPTQARPLYLYEYTVTFTTTLTEVAAGMKMPVSEVGPVLGDPVDLFEVLLCELSTTYRDEVATAEHALKAVVDEILNKLPPQTFAMGGWKPRIGKIAGACYGVSASLREYALEQYSLDTSTCLEIKPIHPRVVLAMESSNN